jgi:hypothetical protein
MRVNQVNVELSKNKDWWNSLDRKAQKAYLAAHPQSRFAKLGIKKADGTMKPAKVGTKIEKTPKVGKKAEEKPAKVRKTKKAVAPVVEEKPAKAKKPKHAVKPVISPKLSARIHERLDDKEVNEVAETIKKGLGPKHIQDITNLVGAAKKARYKSASIAAKIGKTKTDKNGKKSLLVPKEKQEAIEKAERETKEARNQHLFNLAGVDEKKYDSSKGSAGKVLGRLLDILRLKW